MNAKNLLFVFCVLAIIYYNITITYHRSQRSYIISNHLNSDLSKIGNWAFHWKMSLNPDPSKQAQEVTFSC